ncbi:hypothetical protein GCM10011594_08480 [Nakamurella endophytica]|uniref:Alpha-amylase n=1 Tax=Nakamurella endophytica TaxID=1748367 RepID=A0A917WBX2_9ACTN|nr:hypothetical protein GCM10011594_08480 [Nakamurella endophytica]
MVGVSAVLMVGLNQSSVAQADTAIASVTLAGDLDSEIGCAADWQPDCAAAHLAVRPDGLWGATFDLPAPEGGSYQYKMAINDAWTVSYGEDGGQGNVVVRVPSAQPVTFVFDPVSHLVTDSRTSVTAVGSFQTQLGCSADGNASCPQSWLSDRDGDGVYTLSTGTIAPGTYTLSVATVFGAGPTYGQGGAAGGAPVTFTVPRSGGGSTTTISYTAATHAVTVSSVPLVQAPPATFGHPTARRGDVIANLFEWNWVSVARECRTVLGPAGYGGVQVAPPQDSINNQNSNPGVAHPWWEVYQPVDYKLTSRMGNEAQFKAMVRTCRAAGVKVYVDTVINHMTGQGSTSYGGVTGWSKYDYPGMYSNADFHHYPADCPQADGTIHDFNNVQEVFKCELVGLSDLRTESAKVRTTIAAYLNKLLSYGVSGFRVDAAKHIGQADLSAIEAKLRRTVDGQRPYIALEVSLDSPGRLTPWAFFRQGDVLGFDFAEPVRSAFTSTIADLSVFGEDAGLVPSDKSLAFVQNHDTERPTGTPTTLSYKDGATNTLATEFLLAYGYGTPQVYSGFAFSDREAGPPSDADGMVRNADCADGWACTHRSRGVANLVDFHNYAMGAPVRNFWDDGSNLISFSRGTKAWIAMNNHTTPQTRSFRTGLRAGTYCDVVHGTFTTSGRYSSCTGPTVRVDARGIARVTVPAKDSVAFDARNLVRPRS